MRFNIHRREQRELRHDRHTVSLLTDHMVFSPKQPREILAGVVALALDGIIRKTCKDLNIEIIDITVNGDHVHLFVKYPSKYSVSYIAKRIKGGAAENCAKRFHISRNGVIKVSGHHPVSMDRCMDGTLWRDTSKIRRSRMRKRYAQALDLSPGFSDLI